jgi:uncharacterized protein
MNKQETLTKLGGSIIEIKRRFSVKNLAIFGSTARNNADDNSDVDMLVTFNQKASFDLFMDLKFYLEDLLGIKVDLVTDKALRPQIRKEIERDLINVS